MKKILCANPACEGVFCHQISSRSIEYGRQGQKLLVTGQNWTSIGSCQWCKTTSSVACEDGKIDESELRYKQEEPVEKTPEPAK